MPLISYFACYLFSPWKSIHNTNTYLLSLCKIEEYCRTVYYISSYSKSQNKKEKKFEMRWAQPEEFTELIVMPRMLLDHLPECIDKTLITLIEQQKD